MRTKRTAGILAGVAATAMLLGACDTAGDEETASGDASAETDNGTGEGDARQGADEGAGATGQPFGAACDAVPEDGDGSFDGMAQDPVATAASNNPVLSTLVTAVGEAELVDTLNGAEDITVFAPANDAFEAIPSEDLDALLADQEALTDVLTYHVVDERLTLDDLGDGEFETLQGSSVQTTADGENVTVDGDAQVVCGNVQTANATVYIIDAVLMP